MKLPSEQWQRARDQVGRAGGRGVDAPVEIDGRRRRSMIASCAGTKGVWAGLSMLSRVRPTAQVLINSSAVKAHCRASGGKKGAELNYQPLGQGACQAIVRATLPWSEMPCRRGN